MANLYNMNRRTLIDDEPLVAWKGKAFTQITSIIKKNKPNSVSTSSTKGIIFLPNALKIYRREIAANMDLSGCHSSRVSLKIDEFDRPNGSLVYNYASRSLPTSIKGVTNYIDLGVTTDTTDLPGSCSSCNTSTNTTGAFAFSQAQNALKRVRSSGMIRKKFNATSNKPVYYTDTTQFLTSRNKTFDQNSFNYFNGGNPLANPGTNGASGNSYHGNGTNACDGKFAPVYFKPNNPQFSQQGGVSSSSLTNRVKYDSINTVAYRTSVTNLGNAVADAYAYGVSEQPYTLKDRLGYPLRKTPKINKYNGLLSKCYVTKIRNAI